MVISITIFVPDSSIWAVYNHFAPLIYGYLPSSLNGLVLCGMNRSVAAVALTYDGPTGCPLNNMLIVSHSIYSVLAPSDGNSIG
jgi:hypothetical protein